MKSVKLSVEMGRKSKKSKQNECNQHSNPLVTDLLFRSKYKNRRRKPKKMKIYRKKYSRFPPSSSKRSIRLNKITEEDPYGTHSITVTSEVSKGSKLTEREDLRERKGDQKEGGDFGGRREVERDVHGGRGKDKILHISVHQ